MPRPRKPRRKFSERLLLEIENEEPNPLEQFERSRSDAKLAVAEELCRVEGKPALSDLDEYEMLEILGRAERQLVAEGKILPFEDEVEIRKKAIADAQVQMATWAYRAGYGTGGIIKALRDRGRPLPIEDCNLIADFVEGKFKLPKGRTLAAARRAAKKTKLLRMAAWEVDRLKEQWCKERGKKQGDADRALDEIVAKLPFLVSNVARETIMDAMAGDTGLLPELAYASLEWAAAWYVRKYQIKLQPHEFRRQLAAFMRKRKGERGLHHS